MADLSYHDARDIRNAQLLREMLPELPPFCAEFFRGITPETTPLTRLNYARDLLIFFDFLLGYKSCCAGKTVPEITCDDMAQITMTDIETYLDYLTAYTRGGKMLHDDEAAKERKLSSLRALLRYLFKRERIPSNVAALVDLPKRHDREIVRLEVDEVAKLLDLVDEGGKTLTPKQAEYHKKTRLRDLALISLLLGTGIRVSECVGLDLNDVDFSVNGFLITRKGGQRVVLYFPEEVADVLREYIDERKTIQAQPGHENALFLSTQKRRMDVRSVQNLVKKYASLVTPLKHITPHKLRSTFGTNLYAETGDIYLVADVLGHADVNTTRRHYAAQSDENRRRAAHSVKLRGDGGSRPPKED